MKFEITSKHVIIGSAIAAVVGVVGTVVFVISETNEMRRLRDEDELKEDRLEKVLKKLDESIDSLSTNMESHIDISPMVRDEALDRAINHVADTFAHEAVHESYQDIKHMADEKVEAIVEGIKPAAETEVRRQLQRKANDVYIDHAVKIGNNVKIQNIVDDISNKLERDARAKLDTEIDRITSGLANQVEQQAAFVKEVRQKMSI